MSRAPAPLARAVDLALEATVALSFSSVGHAVRARLEGWDEVTDLPGAGRHVVVTGANSGLGYATASLLLRSGAQVLGTVRSQDKAEDTARRLTEELGADVASRFSTDLLDLSSLDDVRAFAARRLEDTAPVDTIVHNAGAMFPERGETGDGIERTYQIHVVAPFLLTSLLLDSLGGTGEGRVITVTSGGMYAEELDTARVDSPDGYRPTTAYARAKRAQVTLTREWARRFGDRGVAFHVAHPGWALTPGVESSLPGFRRIVGPILRDAEDGADTTAFLVLADGLPSDGRLWHDRRPRLDHKVPWTRPDRGEAGALWARVCLDAGITPS
ncbi:MAG: SDR family NAD(P)-dependent oxidoreductase [Nitriliruptoraceae bacterium]|nr:SDR family NAD(P)-dependent oxidoreductase [Nitriliruptoraceae bacterium]